jgi:hypothetical protein
MLFGLPNNVEANVIRAISCLLGSFLLLGAIVGQTAAPSAVTKALICDGPAACGHGYINGREYETLASENIGIVVVGDIAGKYLRADILVLNKSASTVDVLPSNFVLTEVTPKQKPLKYIDGDKVLRSEERRLAFGNALTAMGGSMARQQSTSTTTSTGTVRANGSDGSSATGSYNGTSTSTTSSPDYAARARAAETIQARNEAFANYASFTSRTFLRANTLPPNQSVRGYMLFERDKKAKLVMLSGIIGDTIYQFPFEVGKP